MTVLSRGTSWEVCVVWVGAHGYMLFSREQVAYDVTLTSFLSCKYIRFLFHFCCRYFGFYQELQHMTLITRTWTFQPSELWAKQSKTKPLFPVYYPVWDILVWQQRKYPDRLYETAHLVGYLSSLCFSSCPSMWGSEDNMQESILFFHHGSSGDQAQVSG